MQKAALKILMQKAAASKTSKQPNDIRWSFFIFIAIVLLVVTLAYGLFGVAGGNSSLSASANTGILVSTGGIGFILLFYSCCRYNSGHPVDCLPKSTCDSVFS